MYYEGDYESGLPPRIYRSVCEIRNEICDIKKRIKDTEQRVNIRALLVDMLSSVYSNDPEFLIPELYELIEDAKEALSELSELEEELSSLREELCETKCVVGR